MRRVTISTIGTSLLASQINRAGFNENNWYSQLRGTANLFFKRIVQDYPEVLDIIHTLEIRALSSLNRSEIRKIR